MSLWDDPKTQTIVTLLGDHQSRLQQHHYVKWCQHYEPELRCLYQRLQHHCTTLKPLQGHTVEFNDFCRFIYQNTRSSFNPTTGYLERPRLDKRILD
jgi:hypothetical protein